MPLLFQLGDLPLLQCRCCNLQCCNLQWLLIVHSLCHACLAAGDCAAVAYDSVTPQSQVGPCCLMFMTQRARVVDVLLS